MQKGDAGPQVDILDLRVILVQNPTTNPHFSLTIHIHNSLKSDFLPMGNKMNLQATGLILVFVSIRPNIVYVWRSRHNGHSSGKR